jgi:flagellar assembly protein FliH
MHEDFKPLHSVEEVLPKEAKEVKEEKLEKQQLLKQIEALKDTVRVLEMELLECKGKNQELARLNSKLVEEKNLLEAEKKALEERITELKALQGSVEGLCQALLEKFSGVEDKVRNEIKDTALNIAKRLYFNRKASKGGGCPPVFTKGFKQWYFFERIHKAKGKSPRFANGGGRLF